MALFEIRHNYTNQILFSLETESIKLCLERAVNSGANLREANLQGANLQGANLRGADLWGADLWISQFRFAQVFATTHGLRIGCEHRTWDEWAILADKKQGNKYDDDDFVGFFAVCLAAKKWLEEKRAGGGVNWQA